LEVFVEFHHQPHRDTVMVLNFLAKLLRQMGRKTEAESTYREALAMQRTLGGDEYANVDEPLNGLLGVLLSQSKMGEAEELLTDILAANQNNQANRAYLFSKASGMSRPTRQVERSGE